MRFTVLSNSPWTASGYGQQTRITVNRLAAAGHEIGIICYYGLQGGVLNLTSNIMCLPVGGHPYGNDVTVPHTMAFKGQFMVSLTDVWVMNPEDYPPGFKWVAWAPVDHDPMPVAIRGKLNSAWKRIAMSKFGETQIKASGLDCMYAPLMVETELLKPKSKTEAREALGLPKDRWIAGMVAMNKGNPSRKNFVEQITAFRECQKRHPDMFLFLQTGRGDGGGDLINLPELCRNLGMVENKDYGFSNPYQTMMGYPPPYFAELYPALDVLLSVTAGEGFGIPIIEAQACGTPVLVGGWTSMPELCHAGRVFDKADAYPEYSQFASYRWKPLQRPLELMIEAEYQHPSDATGAPQWVHDEYDADVCIERYWKPILAKIEAAL